MALQNQNTEDQFSKTKTDLNRVDYN